MSPPLEAAPVVVGRTRADNRALSETDRFYFLLGMSHIASIFSFKSTLLRSDKKLLAACQRVVEMTPLLQTEIGGDADHWPYFRQIPNQQDWPCLEILHVNDDEEALQKAHSLQDEIIARFDASMDNRRKAADLLPFEENPPLYFPLPHCTPLPTERE